MCADAAKAAGLTLEGLGIAPDSLEAIAPQYLWRFRAPRAISGARARSDYFPSASAIRPTVPTMTRHHAKNVKPWRVT